MVASPALPCEFEVLADDSVIGPAIARGGWEDHETRLFRAHLRPGARALDLGANIGWFAVQGVLAGARVESFEPIPGIAAIARRNIERAMRHGAGSAVVHECAAGSARGTATIHLAAKNRGDNRIADDRPGDMAEAQALEIRVERVDDVIEGGFDVAKIDTQGSEWHALRGMPRTLAASPRLALLIEFWPYALRGAKPEELLRLLEAEGFVLGKATAAPYPMDAARILRQALARDPVKGGLDLYGVRGGSPFHVLGPKARLHGLWRSLREG
jgi:FkbM family methyltransferase